MNILSFEASDENTIQAQACAYTLIAKALAICVIFKELTTGIE